MMTGLENIMDSETDVTMEGQVTGLGDIVGIGDAGESRLV